MRRLRPARPAALRLLIVLALVLVACGEGGVIDTSDPEVDTVVGDDWEIFRTPTRFQGEVVAVAGTVDRTLDGGFLLAPEPGGELALPVLTALRPDVEEGSALEAVGFVRPFDPEEAEQDLGQPVEDGQFAEYEGEPVLLAQEVRPLTPDVEFVDEASLQGHTVVVTGAVEDVLAPGAFLLEGGVNTQEPFLVLGADQGAVTEGEQVTVRARVRQFERAEVSSLYGDAVAVALAGEFDGLNYLVAEEVE